MKKSVEKYLKKLNAKQNFEGNYVVRYTKELQLSEDMLNGYTDYEGNVTLPITLKELKNCLKELLLS